MDMINLLIDIENLGCIIELKYVFNGLNVNC